MNSIFPSWALVNNHFHNCSLHLTALAGGLYYRCDLVYSDPSGVNTASTILSRTQEWLMDNNITTIINGTKMELSKLCTLQLDDSSMATCYRVIEHLAETTTAGIDVGIIAGVFCGGLVVGALTGIAV